MGKTSGFTLADHRAAKGGFTLVELSIVLVIIGLLAGGILVGQDLIKAAELRKTISQFQAIQTAINTFRIKYNGLAGDMTNASDFITGAVNGNGDEIINGGNSGQFETYNLWHQLSAANLINGQFSPISADPTAPYRNLGLPSPVENNIFFVLNASPYTYAVPYNYIVLAQSQTPRDAFGSLGLLAQNFNTGVHIGLHPLQAQSIDQKMDDGLPLSGQMLSMMNEISHDAQNSCPNPDDSNGYNVKATYYNCIQVLRLQ